MNAIAFNDMGELRAVIAVNGDMSKTTCSISDIAPWMPPNFWGSLQDLGTLPQKFGGQIWQNKESAENLRKTLVKLTLLQKCIESVPAPECL